MSVLPLIDGRWLEEQASEIVAACTDPGAFFLMNPPLRPGLSANALDAARAFFALTPEEKASVHISQSPHFRGYSEMHNSRDWREQVHLASELPAARGEEPYLRLQGSNLWPASLGESWRTTLLGYLAAIGELGSDLLQVLARGLGLPESRFGCDSRDPPYLLMKLINYHPQPGGGVPRVGVAPHCDWSWITLLLQCDVGGLQVRTPSGEWGDVPPMPNSLVVNVGELVEVVTGGRVRATPHRVVNHSSEKPRVSIPVFVNPPLSFVVEPEKLTPHSPFLKRKGEKETEHVHRVLNPDAARTPFVFGESEWQRKGLGQWCYRSECCGS